MHKTAAEYRTLRETKTSDLASVGAGYQALLSLEMKFGRESQARLELENRELLEADLRGPCGRVVITKVFVGHGNRRVFAAVSKQASVSISTPTGAIGPKGESSGTDVDELAWQNDQAYAFDVRDFGGESRDAVAVDVHLPSIVTEGEELHISFESPREAWLVVYYVDADNKAEVLWPSNEEPTPSVKPSRVTTLPSPAEQAAGIKIRPTLSRPGQPSREQLIVYAFADKRDFDLVKPPSGSSSTMGVAFADELTKKLRDIPASRWTRQQLGYAITPVKK